MFKTSMAKLGLALLALAIIFGSFSAQAQDISQDSIKALQAQIDALQKQLEEVKAAQVQAAAKAAQAEAATKAAQAEGASKTAAAAPAPGEPTKTALIKPEGRGTLKVGDRVKVTVGGFVEAASIYRSKNEVADIGSNFNTAIPFDLTGASKKGADNPIAHQSEFRETARQSRITALVEAKATEHTTISGYLESDFLGAGQTANSNESNSYNPRVRVFYGTIDESACGVHFLAGQEWSLLTTDKVGIIPRQENIPLTIDAQYVPGFNWTRNPQLRLAKDFDDQKIWLAISAESPQAVLTGIGTPPSFINATNAGGSLFDKNNNYTSDFAPDIIAKAAFDPGYGHYEIFGITRFFHDYVLAAGAPEDAALGNNDACWLRRRRRCDPAGHAENAGSSGQLHGGPRHWPLWFRSIAGFSFHLHRGGQAADRIFCIGGRGCSSMPELGTLTSMPAMKALTAQIMQPRSPTPRALATETLTCRSASNRHRMFGRLRPVFGIVSMKAISARCRSVRNIRSRTAMPSPTPLDLPSMLTENIFMTSFRFYPL